MEVLPLPYTLKDVVAGLTWFHYGAAAIAGLLVLLLLVLAVALWRRPLLSALCFFCACGVAGPGAVWAYNTIEDRLRGCHLDTLTLKRLHFSPGFVLEGQARSSAQKPIQRLHLLMWGWRAHDNVILESRNLLRAPLREARVIALPLEPQTEAPFSLFIDDASLPNPGHIWVLYKCF